MIGRRIRLLALALLVPLAASGCSLSLYNVALPGGAATGSQVYRVNIDFANVLDLVPQSAVKVDDVTVGTVEAISLHGYVARVRVRLKDSVKLPANAIADIRMTSLLGEKFVALAPPTTVPPEGRLTNGALIPLSRTGRSVEVEEVLGALSLILNGGSIEELQTINRELGKALSGREPQIRDLLTQLNTFIGGLNQQKSEIVRALQGLDRLSATLAAQRKTIEGALDTIGPGLKVLADQRAQLTQMLVALSQLGAVGTRIIQQSRDNTLADLAALQPILANLAAAGSNLPNALELLMTYPFPRNIVDAVVPGANPGSYYTRLDAQLNLDQLSPYLAGLAIKLPALTTSQGGSKAGVRVPSGPSGSGLTGLPSKVLGAIPGVSGDSVTGALPQCLAALLQAGC